MIQKKREKYWLKKANLLSWDKYPKKAFIKKKQNHFEWYPDGKINLYKNLISKHLKKNSKKICIITIDKKGNLKKYSYDEINHLVEKFLNQVKIEFRVKNLQRAIIHSSASIESAVAMLACIKTNVYFSVIFEDLSLEAIEKRVKLFKPNIILTKSHNHFSNLKSIFKKKVFLLDVDSFNKNIINKKFKSKILKSSSNFFCLFTSGSTGVPKGIIHKYGGYSVWCKETCKAQFGMNNKSIVLTASDAGWINGHTYSLFGPLFFGGTSILLESPIIILNENILKKIKNLKISILYLPVTLIRLLKSVTKRKNFFIKSIKALGSMGEPLAPDIGEWYEKFFRNKSKAVVNTYFQTETGGILISPKYNDNIFKSPHGSVGNPVSKFIEISKLDKLKREIKILYPWPGIMSDVLNGKKVWNKYWDKRGKFRLFDLASKEKKAIYVHGRIDDVINIRGHRIGSEEIESILLTNDKVFECCAVSINDEIEGSKFLVFIVGKKNLNKNELIELVIKNFGTFAIPKNIITLSELPKTRSGKILRRLLRDIANNDNEINDISTMINPHVINEIKNKIRS